MQLSAPKPALASAWDPQDKSWLASRKPTKECLQRVRNDLKSLTKSPLDGIFAVQDETVATVVHAVVLGPADTPYEYGFFYFILDFPDDYPQNPPRVKLMTTGGGRVRFNPNLYANGKVCLSILGTWSGPGWVPIHTLSSVLLSIQTLMSEKPYHNEPGFEAPNVLQSNQYNDVIRHETVRVAVCEMVEDTSQSQLLPPQLRVLVQSLFPSFYDSYEITCQGHLHKDGQKMVDPFGDPRGTFEYAALLKRLESARDALEAEEEGDGGGDDDGGGKTAGL